MDTIVFIIFLPKFNNINYLKLLFLFCGFIKFLIYFYFFIKKNIYIYKKWLWLILEDFGFNCYFLRYSEKDFVKFVV
jgi:hypothetical protein